MARMQFLKLLRKSHSIFCISKRVHFFPGVPPPVIPPDFGPETKRFIFLVPNCIIVINDHKIPRYYVMPYRYLQACFEAYSIIGAPLVMCIGRALRFLGAPKL